MLVRYRVILCLLPVFFISCYEGDMGYSRSTYRCCSSDCIDRKHLITEELFDKNGSLVQQKNYYPEEPHHLVQLIRHQYKNGLLFSSYDSTEFTINNTTRYENNLLKDAITVALQRTVVNEIIDTIPHTAWVTVYDTITRFFEYTHGKIFREIELKNKDTLTVKNYRYKADGKLTETRTETELSRYFYLPNDSIGKIEIYDFTVSGSNTSAYQPEDARWNFSGTIEFNYDSNGRKTEKLEYDNLDNLLFRYIYRYDDAGKLINIREETFCDTLVYTKVTQ